MRSPTPTTEPDPSGDADAPRRDHRRHLASPHVAALVAAVRACDHPLRSAIGAAVRRFVRAEREVGRTLDEVLEELRSALHLHVEPTLTPDRSAALHTAAQWFAVSEYHRAD